MLRFLISAALLLVLSAPAHAQEDANPDTDTRARELFQNGALLYEEGRYNDAIVAWQEAHDLSQRPGLLYNIANAQERLGMWREALDTLNRYRVYAPAEERESLNRRIANLERRLAEDTPGNTTPDPVVRAAEPEPERTPEPAGASPKERRWLPVVGMSVGAAGLATGTAFALRAQDAREQVASSCVDALCLDSAEPALLRDQRSSIIADSAFVLGGAALIGGVVLLSVDGSQLSVVPGGVRFSGTF